MKEVLIAAALRFRPERGDGIWAGESAGEIAARPKRILLMWSATGGGHRASAEAVKAGIERLYGDRYHVDSVDMWSDHTEWPTNQASVASSLGGGATGLLGGGGATDEAGRGGGALWRSTE